MSDPQPSVPPPQPSSPSRKPLVVAVSVLGVVALGTGWYILKNKGEPPSTPPPPAAAAPTPPAQPEAPQPPGPPLPALDQSDTRTRELAGAMSTDPELQKWLAFEGLIRRFTAASANIAEGESPRAVLPFLAPQGAFQVVERNGRTFIAPESFARYDTVARALTSLDTQATATTYKALKPLVDQAFAEIAPPGQRFDETLSRAIQRMLDTPVPEGDLEVVDTPGVNYAYAAPELEQLSAAQKHLLRMGPANARALQAKLRELHGALGLPAAGR
ncbi:DUF3014 domain-containing protein [Hyalangium sp.]|uniref:DUF3014 domain-containing protein n=1 Tax=Hyalangium sp. TaxID=2028555 RepID=UPI002D4A1C34|nr:DUF3014 domain-containing protein [Hyalangium sp.]HYH96756.1 DUF3014 domain-containing protein [Hyalangium sp.]